jgi:hypothetical protein
VRDDVPERVEDLDVIGDDFGEPLFVALLERGAERADDIQRLVHLGQYHSRRYARPAR